MSYHMNYLPDDAHNWLWGLSCRFDAWLTLSSTDGMQRGVMSLLAFLVRKRCTGRVRPMHSNDASQESHKKSNSQHKLAGCNSAACGHILFVHCKAVTLSTLWRCSRRHGEVINCAVTDRRPRKLLVDHWYASVVTEMVKLTMNGLSFMAAQQKSLGHGVWCNSVTNV